jgi:hypothetical protein
MSSTIPSVSWSTAYQQQVDVQRIETGVGQHPTGGADGQIGGVLVVGRHPAHPDTGGLREHARRQRQSAGHRHPALQVGRAHLALGQAAGRGGDTHAGHGRSHGGSLPGGRRPRPE